MFIGTEFPLSVLNIHPRMEKEGRAEKPNEIQPDEY
jgi:hypothetical protein